MRTPNEERQIHITQWNTLFNAITTRLERGWTKEVYARNKEGKQIDPYDSDACAWCLMGAIDVSAHALDFASESYVVVMACKTLATLADTNEWGLTVWNDDPARTKDEVLDLVKRARKMLTK